MRAGFWQRLKNRIPWFFGALWMVFILLFALAPVYWIALSSVKRSEDLMTTTPKFWVSNPTLASYVELWNEQFIKFDRLTVNSLVVTISATILSVLVAVLAGLALTRLRFPGRKLLGMSVFFVYLVPASLLFLPLYVMMAGLRLHDSRLGLVLVYTSFSAPFCIWMLRGFLMSIPRELEESAMIDGCSRLGAWLRVVLPLAGPGIAATAVFGFTLAWNEFLYAYVLTETSRARTMPIGLVSFIQSDTYRWGELSAGAVVMALPVVVLYFVCQRFIVSGLTGGAVKG